jgi:hypothetical protein
MKFTKIPDTTFKEMVMNAGILLTSFDPTSAEVDAKNIIGATSGGVTFNATPTFTDLGDDIDNCPKNMAELKRLDSWEAKMSGTFATINNTLAKSLAAAADVSGNKITPRNDIATTDFTDIWWVGDYSDKNGDANGGFVAIHLDNALSTGGLQISATDKSKGKFSFEYTAHYSIDSPDTVPYEIYIKEGTAEA